MAELSIQEILDKVRENKETLEKQSLELEEARNAVEQLGSDLLQARKEIEEKEQALAEKDEAIEDLLAQNQDLQESLARYQHECEAMRSASDDKNSLIEQLNALLT